MIHSVVSAEYKEDFLIEVVFDDGRRGVVDFSGYVKRGGVYERFLDPDYFQSFKINKDFGVLTWGDGEIDIAPETLYTVATGDELPRWMVADPSADE